MGAILLQRKEPVWQISARPRRGNRKRRLVCHANGMQIYILRHGIAEDPKPGQADASRRLTQEGRDKLARVLSCARKAGVEPDTLLSSPYRRAIESAELARETLELRQPIVQTKVLTPTVQPGQVWEEIRTYKDARQIMLVGHEPQLSGLICYLMEAPEGRVEMKKGAIARVDVDSLGPRPAGVLVWLLTAKLAGA
jgi:phosphohistidine phosphatase